MDALKKTKLNKRYYILLAIQTLLTLDMFYYMIVIKVHSLPIHTAIVSSMDMLAEGILLMIAYSIVNQASHDEVMKARFLGLVFTTSVYIFVNTGGYLVDNNVNYRMLNITYHTIFYMGSVSLAWLYWRFIITWINKKIKNLDYFIHAIYVFDMIVILVNAYKPIYFLVTKDGTYMRAPTYDLCVVIPYIILSIAMVVIMKSRQFGLRARIILMIFPLAPLIGSFVAAVTNTESYVAIEVFVSMVLIYCNIYVTREKQFMEQQNQIIQQEKELQERRIEVTKLQMNPHFIYNTLASIAGLCTEDPELAEYMTERFSVYLRDTFGQNSDRMMVTFQEEIDNLENYLSIEKIRYPDIIVERDYRAMDFMLPGLSLQPLVENAINHGIRPKNKSGTIKISSWETEEAYMVSVEDNGVGFKGIPDDDRKHIGVANVRYRIEVLCDGTLDISGEQGIGTTSLIRIPKKNKVKGNIYE